MRHRSQNANFDHRGVFTCRGCGKRTRNLGMGNDYCGLCNEKLMAGNSLSDAGYTGNAWAVFENCRTAAAVSNLLTAEIARHHETKTANR